MKTTIARLLSVALTVTLTAPSCTKETSHELTPTREEQAAHASARSGIESEFLINDLFDNVLGVNNEVGMAGLGIFGRQAPSVSSETARTDSIQCFTLSITPAGSSAIFPLTVTLDFGSGCTGRDGRTRSGRIRTVYTGRLTQPGQSATTTLENYRIDSLAITGTADLSNTGSLNRRQFTLELSGIRLSRPGGDYVQWNSRRMYTQSEGLLTPEWPLDDVFTVEGGTAGKVKASEHIYLWTSEITDPLVRKLSCRWPVRGALNARREGVSTDSPWAATLDFGTGNCDGLATLRINEVESQITLY